jgi:hypothetical protein
LIKSDQKIQAPNIKKILPEPAPMHLVNDIQSLMSQALIPHEKVSYGSFFSHKCESVQKPAEVAIPHKS